jgi:hypothetical protein
VDADRPDVHRGSGLMVDVQEERRQRDRDGDSAERTPYLLDDPVPHAGTGSRERSDGHGRPLYWPL